jgi:ubiquitin-protein ligase
MAEILITEKRLRNELKDLKKNKLDFAQAIQDETNKFIFYFLLVGDKEDPKNKETTGHYACGYYIGKIMLPPTYPDKPGDFMMLTPNGRFAVNSKICLTNSGYHSESWSPIWSIRNMILGFASIFYVDLDKGISHIKMTKSERLKMASESIDWNKTNQRDIFNKFDQFINEDCTVKKIINVHNTIADEPLKEVIKVKKNDPLDQKQLEAQKEKKMEEDEEELMKEIMADIKKKEDNERILKEAAEMDEILRQISEAEKKEKLYVDNVENFVIKDNLEKVEDEKPIKVSKIVKVEKIPKIPTIKIPFQEKQQKQIIIKKTRAELTNEKMEIIRKMTYDTYDYKIFIDVQNLMGLNLNEL